LEQWYFIETLLLLYFELSRVFVWFTLYKTIKYITNFPFILLFMFEFVFYLCTLFSFIKVLFYWVFLAKVFNEADRFLHLGFGLIPPSFFLYILNLFLFNIFYYGTS
jgi:hypothetical protein